MGYYYGYGADLSEISHLKSIKEFIKKYDDEMYKEIIEIYDHEPSEDEVNDWLNEIEFDGYIGLAAVVKEIIKRNEGIEFHVYDEIIDGCIYIPALYPWQFNDVTRNLKSIDVERILQKYISELTDEPIDVKSMRLYITEE